LELFIIEKMKKVEKNERKEKKINSPLQKKMCCVMAMERSAMWIIIELSRMLSEF
jgi:hypothetical protein